MPLALDDILVTIAKNIGKLLPLRVINKNEQAVRYFMGEANGTLERGLYFFVPLLGKIEIIGKTDGDIDLGLLTVDTGEKTVSASGSLIYRITTGYKYEINLDDDDAIKVLRGVGRGYISEALSADYSSFVKDRKNALEKVRAEMTKETEDRYGVEIKRIFLHDLISDSLNLRHLGNNPPETTKIFR
jgi:regulator of protease activity HflC (stomatin/prohibitin superfamily)